MFKTPGVLNENAWSFEHKCLKFREQMPGVLLYQESISDYIPNTILASILSFWLISRATLRVGSQRPVR